MYQADYNLHGPAGIAYHHRHRRFRRFDNAFRYVTVNDGADQAFTIAANSGYNISNVTVDGVSQGPVTGYTFHGVSDNHNINATFYATSIAGTTGCVTVPANQVNYIIDASAVAQTKVTVSTDGSDSCVRVEHYSGNPHPEAPLPANALNKFNDVLVGMPAPSSGRCTSRFLIRRRNFRAYRTDPADVLF